jgi:GTP:adenosylcobinamide-phosphate guanylyltransferase
MRCRQAVLLAAGRGARLMPLTAERPKCLVTVAGRAILDRAVDGFAAAGFERVLVVAGYRADAIRAHVAGRPGPAIEVVENPAWATTNNAASLWAARASLAPPFAIADGDLVLAPEVVALAAAPDRIVVADDPAAGSRVVVGPGGVVRGITCHGGGVGAPGKKTVNLASVSAASWADGIAPALAALIARGDGDHAYYEAAFGEAIAAGRAAMTAVDVAGGWHEIDDVEDLLRVEAALSRPAATARPATRRATGS